MAVPRCRTRRAETDSERGPDDNLLAEAAVEEEDLFCPGEGREAKRGRERAGSGRWSTEERSGLEMREEEEGGWWGLKTCRMMRVVEQRMWDLAGWVPASTLVSAGRGTMLDVLSAEREEAVAEAEETAARERGILLGWD